MNVNTINEGRLVKYHPVIGGPDDGRVYEVRAVGSITGNRMVVSLKDKIGCVAPEALSPAEESEGRT